MWCDPTFSWTNSSFWGWNLKPLPLAEAKRQGGRQVLHGDTYRMLQLRKTIGSNWCSHYGKQIWHVFSWIFELSVLSDTVQSVVKSWHGKRTEAISESRRFARRVVFHETCVVGRRAVIGCSRFFGDALRRTFPEDIPWVEKCWKALKNHPKSHGIKVSLMSARRPKKMSTGEIRSEFSGIHCIWTLVEFGLEWRFVIDRNDLVLGRCAISSSCLLVRLLGNVYRQS